MPKGRKEAFLSKVTFRRESDWFSKTRQILEYMDTTNWPKVDLSKVEYKPSQEQLDKEYEMLKSYTKPVTIPIQIEAEYPVLKGSVETKEVEYHAHTDNYEIQNITWSSNLIGE